jgi:hypothetical protein
MLFTNLIAVALATVGAVEASYAIPGTSTGINSATHARPARRNINDLVNDYYALYVILASVLKLDVFSGIGRMLTIE